MVRKRQRRTKKGHYALLVNRKAARYQARAVSRLISAIRARGDSYSLYEPETAVDLLKQSEVAAGLRKANARYPRPFDRGGKVTALVACGGDGTFNLVARSAHKTGLSAAIFPLGRLNNMAASFYGTVDPDAAIKKILSSSMQLTDVATAGNLPFFGSIGLGFSGQLVEELEERGLPHFGLGWSQLAARAAARVEPHDLVLKVDSFRFEIQPLMLNINLVSHSAGLPLSPASIPDDGHFEVIFDTGIQSGNFSSFARLIHKRRYLYGDEMRLYRGRVALIQSVEGRKLCLDGESIDLPTDALEIKVDEKKLQVLC
jgi:diacylglycerol kinase family enzyme